jgi:hypothetical protein
MWQRASGVVDCVFNGHLPQMLVTRRQTVRPMHSYPFEVCAVYADSHIDKKSVRRLRLQLWNVPDLRDLGSKRSWA